jgi:hypothetical protein
MHKIKVMVRSVFLTGFVLMANVVFAQLIEIPEAVKEAFSTQYPGAENVTYEDNLVSVQVHFQKNGEKMVAAYNNKGRWKNTEKELSYDQLPEAVKDGFQKSKYADWKVSEVKLIYQPGGADRYRIKAEKNDIKKKNVYFNKSGRLVDDAVTV